MPSPDVCDSCEARLQGSRHACSLLPAITPSFHQPRDLPGGIFAAQMSCLMKKLVARWLLGVLTNIWFQVWGHVSLFNIWRQKVQPHEILPPPPPVATTRWSIRTVDFCSDRWPWLLWIGWGEENRWSWELVSKCPLNGSQLHVGTHGNHCEEAWLLGLSGLSVGCLPTSGTWAGFCSSVPIPGYLLWEEPS